MKKNFLVTGMLLLYSAMSFGAGYQLNMQGLRQLAMGGGGTAIPWDASVIFYNPGALTEFNDVRAYASAQFIMPNTRYVQTPTGTYSADSKSQAFPNFNVYLGGPIVDKSPVSVGLGVYMPFGSGLKWEDDWAGRYITQEVKMYTIFFQPTVSYRFNDVVSLGGGFIYAIGNAKFRQALPIVDRDGKDGTAELKGDAHGLGFNVGLHVRVNEMLQLGVSYRSKVNMQIKRGYATFNVAEVASSSFPYTAFKSELPMPEVFSVGAGFTLSEKLTMQADINFVGWSAFDSLKFDYETHTSMLHDTHLPRKYKNTLALRGGAHYAFSHKLAGMIGVAYDPSPVRDGYVSPDLPDADRAIFTCGLTFRPGKKLAILGAAEFVSSHKRNSAYDVAGFDGKYQTKAFTPGIGLTYDF